MNPKRTLLAASAAALALVPLLDARQEERPAAPRQGDPAPAQDPQPVAGSLTIYNGDLALVREPLELDLRQGENTIAFTRITRRLWPDSVVLHGRPGTGAFAVRQQGYRNDPVSEGFLLSVFEGQTIEFLAKDGEIVEGRIVRSGYVPPPQPGRGWRPDTVAGASPVIEVDGKLRFELPGRPLFPSLGDDTVLEPTLSWQIEAERAGRQAFELAYLSGGLSWEADYNVVLPATEGPANVVGWVTLANQSGRAFQGVDVQLVAGDVAQQAEQATDQYFLGQGSRSRAAAEVQQEAFDAFHLYTLPRPLTLRDRESVQVEFLTSDRLDVATRYVVRTGMHVGDWRFDRMFEPEPKVHVLREFTNSDANGLGVPLPMGTVRFYRVDPRGRMQFVGEARIDHTPKDEEISVATGLAFDVVAERRRIEYRLDEGRRTSTETIELELRNRAETPAEIEVVEVLHRWHQSDVTETSDPYRTVDSSTIAFDVTLAPGETKKLVYSVRYSW